MPDKHFLVKKNQQGRANVIGEKFEGLKSKN
jgi:hypothetical protein